jgi:hypothetical protein
VAAATGREAGIQGLIVISDPMMKDYRRAIVRLAERLRIPAIYDAREFVTAGGLMSYGSGPPCLHDMDELMSYLASVKSGDMTPGCDVPQLHTNPQAAIVLRPATDSGSYAVSQ